MNRSALQLFGVSFLAFVLAATAAGYALFREETIGRQVREFGQHIRSWNSLERSSADQEGAADPTTAATERLTKLFLSGEGDAIGFLAEIDALGKASGVTITTSDLKYNKTAESGFDDIAAVFSLRGPAGAVERMIALLESLPYDTSIDSLSLSRNNGMADATVSLHIGVLE